MVGSETNEQTNWEQPDLLSEFEQDIMLVVESRKKQNDSVKRKVEEIEPIGQHLKQNQDNIYMDIEYSQYTDKNMYSIQQIEQGVSQERQKEVDNDQGISQEFKQQFDENDQEILSQIENLDHKDQKTISQEEDQSVNQSQKVIQEEQTFQECQQEVQQEQTFQEVQQEVNQEEISKEEDVESQIEQEIIEEVDENDQENQKDDQQKSENKNDQSENKESKQEQDENKVIQIEPEELNLDIPEQQNSNFKDQEIHEQQNQETQDEIQDESQGSEMDTSFQLLYLNQVEKDTLKDRAFGCILSSFIGDSVGSSLQFNEEGVTDKDIDDAMKMQGGGPYNIGPGQVTANSEMSMCLIWSIIEANKDKEDCQEKELNTDLIAKWYKIWLDSEPFNVADPAQVSLLPLLETASANVAKETARQQNQGQECNISLVRMAPIAVWTSTLDDIGEIESAVIEDVEFVQCTDVVQKICFLYTVAMSYLLQHPEDQKRAWNAYDVAFKLSQQDNQNREIEEDQEQPLTAHDCLLVAQQLSDQIDIINAEQKNDNDDDDYLPQHYDCIEDMSNINHAFILSFYFLLRGDKWKGDHKSFFRYALKQVVSLAGDSDINAMTVMSMIGAFVGIHEVPTDFLYKIIEFDCKNEQITLQRPSFLSVRENALNNLEALLSLRPLNELLIISDELEQSQQDQGPN